MRFGSKALLLLCFFTPALFGQSQTSVLFGTITNEDLPLPGATVTLSGKVLQGTREVVVGENGNYRFTLLPPGDGYQLTVSMIGFGTVVRKNLHLSLGKSIEMDVALKPETIQDALVVTAETPMVDTSTNQISNNFSGEFLDKITNDRSMSTVMAMAPGVLEGNNPNMLGGSSTDNVYLIDGADNTDPSSKTWGTQINFDAIQDIQVITGGISAEHGRGQGGLVNLVTKSGGNTFEGNFRFLKSDVDWNEEAEGKPFDESKRYTTEDRFAMTLGGPIIKDRLWFFTAFETRGKENQTFHYPNMAAFEGQNTANQVSHNPKYEGHYLNLKLTWQAAVNHRFVVTYNEDPIEFPLRSYLNYDNYEDPFHTRREQGGETAMLEWNWNISDASYVTAKIQSFDSPLNNLPDDGTLRSTLQRPVQQFVTEEAGSYYPAWSAPDTFYTSTRKFQTNVVTYNHFINGGIGSHDLKAGLEFRDSEYGSKTDLYNGGFRMYWVERGDYGAMLIYDDQRPAVNTNEDYRAVFIQDEWRMNDSLTLNLGLRTENLILKNTDQTEIVNQKFGDMMSPRIGFAYEMKGGSLHGSFARYYDAIGDWIVDNSQPNQSYNRDWYWLNPDISDLIAQGLRPWENPDDWAQINPADHPDLWSFRSTSTFGPDGNLEVFGTIDPSHMDEFTLGYDWQISRMYAASVNTYHRTWKDTYEDTDFDQDGQWSFLTNEGTWRKYRAAILTLQKRLGPDGFQFFTSYTWSQTRGISVNDNSTAYLDSPYQVHNWRGKILDVPHNFKFNGSYTTDFGFIVGLNFVLQSGEAWTPEIDVTNLIPDGVNEDQIETVYYEERGSRRLPTYTRTDLHLEYEFKLFQGRVRPSLYLDVFNALDQRRIIDVDQHIGYGSYQTDATPGTQEYIDFVTNNAPVLEDTAANFGEATLYSFPRSYYVGFNVEF